jgi:hypothetical protein
MTRTLTKRALMGSLTWGCGGADTALFGRSAEAGGTGGTPEGGAAGSANGGRAGGPNRGTAGSANGGTYRVLRGGAYDYGARTGTMRRHCFGETLSNKAVGFRCAAW